VSYLDAFTANTFRTDAQGRLVFAPYGKRGKAYLVPEASARALNRFLRGYFALMMVALGAAVLLARHPAVIALVAAAWLAGYFAKLAHFTRGLPTVPEVPDLEREEAIRRVARAMGQRTIAAICAGSALLAFLCGSLAVKAPGIALYFLTAYFAFVALLYAVRWWQFRDRKEAA